MRVLFATDGSEFSEGAARFLARFHFSSDDQVIIIHVISEIPYEDDYRAQVMHAIKRVAPKILAASANILKPVRAKIATLEKEGYPDTTIIETAEETGADLIVMGARGVRGVKMLVLGSSTRAVAINSPIPVLVVKQPPWNMSAKFKIVFATDGSDAARAAGRLLASLPVGDDAEITVMHTSASVFSDIPEKYVRQMDKTILQVPEGVAETESRLGEAIVEEAKTYLSGRYQKIDSLIARGEPFREILRAEKNLQPDIVAVGCRGLRGIRGMMGSVSRRLLSHSASSVLIGKGCARAN
jgi:nucleotide-binding universal stress UspA family protein